MRHILSTKEITMLLDGEDIKGIESWWETPENMPAVQAWVDILRKYEVVTDYVDGNLLSDMQEITTSAKGKTSKPIMDVKRQLELMMEAPAK